MLCIKHNIMDYNSSVKYIIIVLSFIIVGYTIFLLYKDSMNIRNEVVKLKNDIAVFSDTIKQYKILIDENSNDDDDDVYKKSKSWDNNNILDQLLLGSEQLQNLHQLQSEIEEGTNKVSEIEEYNSDSESSQNSDDEKQEHDESQNDTSSVCENQDEEEDTNISFVSKKKKCESILKSGKNKGSNCGRDSYDNTQFCKIHQSD